MSTGLLALLDDVAGIAKLAAASVDDVAAQATKAGAKAAGVARHEGCPVSDSKDVRSLRVVEMA